MKTWECDNRKRKGFYLPKVRRDEHLGVGRGEWETRTGSYSSSQGKVREGQAR